MDDYGSTIPSRLRRVAGSLDNGATDVEKVFWRNIEHQTSSACCWEWKGSFNHGYGRVNISGRRRVAAHRFSYELANGPIPEGMCVLHKCDNPACVNPAHLFIGTRTDNAADRDAKGRTRTGHLYGEANPMAKLTAVQIVEIRAKYAAGNVQKEQLAREYGVDSSLIHRIIVRRSWRTIP